jgi:hypothetical protein
MHRNLSHTTALIVLTTAVQGSAMATQGAVIFLREQNMSIISFFCRVKGLFRKFAFTSSSHGLPRTRICSVAQRAIHSVNSRRASPVPGNGFAFPAPALAKNSTNKLRKPAPDWA